MLLAVLAITADLPGVILLGLGALGGAVAIVAGAMLLSGVLESEGFTYSMVAKALDNSWRWSAVYVALAILGIFVQVREMECSIA